ncbi:hypothetical protein ACP4OV_026593 [Aristida adscensionis]
MASLGSATWAPTEPLPPHGIPRGSSTSDATEAPEAFKEAAAGGGAAEGEEAVEKVGEETVEGWMRESIAEIVRNIGEAPFLVHLFSGDGGEDRVTVRREPAAPESWPESGRRRRWGPGGQRRPDGIIPVEQVAAAAAVVPLLAIVSVPRRPTRCLPPGRLEPWEEQGGEQLGGWKQQGEKNRVILRREEGKID